ncbi:MAG: D-alanyl-D-alanine carboxypeptidase [Pseudomonadota bacterium]
MAFVTRRVVFGQTLMALAALVATAFVTASPAEANSKYAAFVAHAGSGDVLFSRYADKKLYPASLTKMMTLYLLFEEIEAGRLSLDSELKVSTRASGQPPSKLGVRAKSTIDVETAIKALVVKSANDVAVVVAESISGTEWQFAQKMTTRARSLGMRRTTFRNASGLPNRRQITTARDLATLSRRVIQDFPQYYHYFGTKSFAWNGRTYRTHNALVRNYQGADGLKTGYTRRSGFNLATTATRDGHRLIGVVLGGRSGRTRDAHMRKILDQSFARIKKSPSLIASLHRDAPAPRMKPTLVAQLAREAEAAAPTLVSSGALQSELETAAEAFGAGDAVEADAIGALIAATQAGQSDDFNEFEQLKLALNASDAEIDEALSGEGDLETPRGADWHVQVGAYRDKALAQSELEKAARAADMIDFARMVSPEPAGAGDQQTLYRARFVALSEEEADAACAKLQKARVPCFVRGGEAAPQ